MYTQDKYISATKSRNQAFTLVELLVVIAIIAILVGLSYPALQSAIKSANKAKCISNLHNIGAGLFAYAGDNNGCYPALYQGSGTQQWWQSTAPYLGDASPYTPGGVYTCPSVPVVNANGSATFTTFGGPYYRCYGLNSCLRAVQWNYRVNNVKNLSNIILAGDMQVAGWDDLMTNDGMDCWSSGGSSAWWSNGTGTGSPIATTRHSGNAGNFVFCDGHVESLSSADLNSSSSHWNWWGM